MNVTECFEEVIEGQWGESKGGPASLELASSMRRGHAHPPTATLITTNTIWLRRNRSASSLHWHYGGRDAETTTLEGGVHPKAVREAKIRSCGVSKIGGEDTI